MDIKKFKKIERVSRGGFYRFFAAVIKIDNSVKKIASKMTNLL